MMDCEALKTTDKMNDEELKASARGITISLEAVEQKEVYGGPR